MLNVPAHLPSVCMRIIWRLSRFNTFILNLHSSQCGFFKRSLQDDSIPRYHAVRIKKEPSEHKDGKVKVDSFETKPWMTTWKDWESYSWMAEASVFATRCSVIFVKNYLFRKQSASLHVSTMQNDELFCIYFIVVHTIFIFD